MVEWEGGDSPPDTDMALITDVVDVLCGRFPAASDCSGELVDIVTLASGGQAGTARMNC